LASARRHPFLAYSPSQHVSRSSTRATPYSRLNVSGNRLRRWMRIRLLDLSLIILRVRPTIPLRRSLNQKQEGVAVSLAGRPTHNIGGRLFLCIPEIQLCPVPWDHQRQRWLSIRVSRVLLAALAQNLDMSNIAHVANPTNYPCPSWRRVGNQRSSFISPFWAFPSLLR